jgi:hypothetical protein
LRRGGVGGGGCLGNFGVNYSENARQISKHLIIPEPQNAITLAIEISRSPIVCRLLGMLPAIDLDNHFERMTREVAEVNANRRLTPKMMLLEWRLPEMLPQTLFRVRHVTAK